MVDSNTGPTCGDYRILRTLGKGGNAVVKLVEKDGVQYAMKIFEPHAADKARFVEATQAEVAVVQSIDLPSVSKYLEFVTDATWTKRNGQTRQVAFLVMEIISGVELIDFFNQAKRQDDEKYLRTVLLQVARALHTLHAAGVAHRDIKPENIMLTEQFEVKLIDLGYGVQLAGHGQDGFNRTRLGTEMYMAPEVQAGKAYQGADADLFAFGAMLLVLRLMAYPFEEASTRDKGYVEMCRDPTKFWGRHASKQVSEEFKQLVALLLAPEAGSRPTMADVLGHRWMRGEVATPEEFATRFGSIFDEATKTRKEEQDALDIDFQIATAGQRRKGYVPQRGQAEGLFDAAFLQSHAFKPVVPQRRGQLCTQFAVKGEPLELIQMLYNLASDIDDKAMVSSNSWKVTFTGVLETPEIEDDEENEKNEVAGAQEQEETKEQTQPPLQRGVRTLIQAELHELEPNSTYLVSLTRKDGSSLAFYETFRTLEGKFKETVKVKAATTAKTE